MDSLYDTRYEMAALPEIIMKPVDVGRDNGGKVATVLGFVRSVIDHQYQHSTRLRDQQYRFDTSIMRFACAYPKFES